MQKILYDVNTVGDDRATPFIYLVEPKISSPLDGNVPLGFVNEASFAESKVDCVRHLMSKRPVVIYCSATHGEVGLELYFLMLLARSRSGCVIRRDLLSSLLKLRSVLSLSSKELFRQDGNRWPVCVFSCACCHQGGLESF